MPIFQPNARTAETYLAGIGASGALMASAFVMFVILVGVVTFNAWPRAGHLLSGRDGDVSVHSAPKPLATPLPKVPNLAKLIGAQGAATGTQQAGTGQTGRTAPPRTHGVLSNGGQTAVPPSAEGQQPVQGQEPSAPVPQSRNVVTQTVSGVGNVVQASTDSVGDTLGGSSGPGLGGVVGSLGQTVNGTVQGLVGGK
jgi:hypothetical protein